ncbi:MAG: hypothetical protein Q8S22_07755 [Eubacteriales bacterium]|nr:hypothetical protein [Eubacteriales bacterium]
MRKKLLRIDQRELVHQAIENDSVPLDAWGQFSNLGRAQQGLRLLRVERKAKRELQRFAAGRSPYGVEELMPIAALNARAESLAPA